MVQSKRQKKYSFTVNQKKTAEWKRGLVDTVRQYANQYDRIFVFKFLNQRTDLIQDIRKKYRSNSKFVLGKNKVLQIALGRTEEEEVDTNLHLVADQMVGQRGLLFTNERVDKILDYFNEHRVKVESRAGSRAPSTVELEPGIMDYFIHSQEPYLRRLGLTTRLKVIGAGTGVPELLVPYTVSVKGKRLKSNQAALLALMGYKEGDFSVRLYCVWERSTEEFQKFVWKDSQMKLKDAEDDSEDEMTSDEDVDPEEEADNMEISDGLSNGMMLTEEHVKMMDK